MGIGVPITPARRLTCRRPDGHTNPLCDCEPCALFWAEALDVALETERRGRAMLHEEQRRLHAAQAPLQAFPEFRFIAEGLSSGAGKRTLLRHFRERAAEAAERGFRLPLPAGTPAELVWQVQGWIFETAVAAARSDAGLGVATRPLSALELEVLRGRAERLSGLAGMEGLAPHLADLARQLSGLSQARWLAQREATAAGRASA